MGFILFIPGLIALAKDAAELLSNDFSSANKEEAATLSHPIKRGNVFLLSSYKV
jgi:hypothetical protein